MNSILKFKFKVSVSDGDKLNYEFEKYFDEHIRKMRYKKQVAVFGKMRQDFFLEHFGIDYHDSSEYVNRYVFSIINSKKFLLTRMKYDF